MLLHIINKYLCANYIRLERILQVSKHTKRRHNRASFFAWKQALFDELIDGLAKAFKRLLVVLFDGIDDTVLDVILQNDLADVVDGRADSCNLDENFRAVPPVFDHLLDRLQMPDGAGEAV